MFRPRTLGVLVALWHDGRVLMVRNSYRPGTGLPAGGVRRGEDPRQAAVRELREEVGVRVPADVLRFVTDVEIRYESKLDLCRVFELTLETRPEIRIDRREVVWAGWMRPEEALDADPAPHARAYLERERR